MKDSLTNWVLSYNKQNIADDSSDREGKTGEGNCYGLSADASRKQDNPPVDRTHPLSQMIALKR